MGRVGRVATALCAFLAALVAAAGAGADTTAPPCVAAGLVAIVQPDAKAPVTEGPAVAAATTQGVDAPSFADAAYGVDLAQPEAGAAGCVGADAPGGTHAMSGAWSVLDGAVSGAALRADLLPGGGDGSGWHLRTVVKGLTVTGSAAEPIPGATIAVGTWGTLSVRAQVPLPGLDPLRWWAAALELRLVQAHAGLPAGTLILIGYAGASRPPAPPPPPSTAPPAATTTTTTAEPPPPTTTATTPAPSEPRAKPTVSKPKHHVRKRHARRRRVRPKTGLPLTVTPPLEESGYVFPVLGGADWGDTYGADRSDVPGGWHHGDDLFAPLGTPVVAVTDGTVFAVGWERIGGWRLWLADGAGNDFYYAHLSGYTQLARNGRAVKRGDVLGFIGNTGDAFTTPPHLHFEVHPNPLLYLGYDGAVDPTTYLRAWPLARHVHVLPPVRLPAGAPAGAAGSATDFRRLLAVRPLKVVARARPKPVHAAAPPARPRRVAVGRTAAGRGDGALPIVFGIVLVAAALAAVACTARAGRT
jgi:murein DD-endopeptidase MepM/ murein hydrolase activator NlpD